jgi:hypothetical protein
MYGRLNPKLWSKALLLNINKSLYETKPSSQMGVYLECLRLKFKMYTRRA